MEHDGGLTSVVDGNTLGNASAFEGSTSSNRCTPGDTGSAAGNSAPSIVAAEVANGIEGNGLPVELMAKSK